MNWLRPAMNKAKFTPSRSGPLAARNTWATARNTLVTARNGWVTARNGFPEFPESLFQLVTARKGMVAARNTIRF